MRGKKRVFTYIFLCFLGVFTFILIELCKENSLIVERVYSNYLFPKIAMGLSKTFNSFPFSLWEFIYIGIIIVPIYTVIKLIYVAIKKPKSFKVYITKFVKVSSAVLVVGYFLFNLLWGINYYREPLSKLLGYKDSEVENEDLINLCKNVIVKANDLRGVLGEDENGVFNLEDNFLSLSIKAEEGYRYITLENITLHEEYNNTKPVALSKLMSYTGITGMYSPFTGEANINIDIPKVDLPSTISHELAHQRGFAREEEANYLAYLTCVNNPHKEFQYSGYTLALTYLMNDLYRVDKNLYNELTQLYSEGLRRDLNHSYTYWKSKEGATEKLWNKFNDSYLKSNNQSSGVASYGFITKLLLSEYKNGLEN